MDHIKFGDKDYELTVNGISVSGDSLRATVIKGDAPVDTVAADAPADIVTVVSESGETLATYRGFTRLVSAELVKDQTVATDAEGNDTVEDVVTVTLEKPDETATRLDALEDAVDVLTETVLG